MTIDSTAESACAAVDAALSTPPSADDFCAQMARLCMGRASTYSFLSRLYLKEVDEQLLADLKAMRFPASTGNGDMDRGYRAIATYLASSWEGTLNELAADYVRAFLGSGIDALSAAYPFESVYTSSKRLTMQTSRDEVLAIYRAYGLEKNSSWREGEDHIACEMEFMRTLCERAAAAFEQGDEESGMSYVEAQANFMNDHLACWMPMFTFGVHKFAKTGFYRGLADVTHGFIEAERAFLNDAAEEL